MDDESGESMELVKEVPLKELGDANWCKISAWLTEGSRELIPETRDTGRNDLFFVEKMMWMDEQV